MADLWNKKENRIERNVAELDVQGKVFSKTHEFLGGPNASIYLDMGTGDPTPVPANVASGYVSNGATYLTPVQVQAMRGNKEFAKSGLGAVSAIATGADEYLFAGSGAHVLEAMNLIPEGRVEAIQHESPWINHGTGVGASILAALGSAGTSTAAQVGVKGTAVAGSAAIKGAAAMTQKAAAQAALNKSAKSIASKGYDATTSALSKYTLPGVGAKMGRALEGGANKFLMKHGDKLVPTALGNSQIAKRYGPHVSKAVSATIGAGLEGGIWGAGAGISEAIVGAPEESAEHILDSVGTNILIGMAFGGSIAGVTPFLAGAKGAAANVADKLLSFSGRKAEAVGEKFAPYITEVARQAGHPPETVEWLKKAAGGDLDMVKELDDFMRDMTSSAAEAAKVLDLLRIQEQFVQISDIQGFKLDVLLDAIKATNSDRSIHFNPGAIFDKDSVLTRLKADAAIKIEASQRVRGKKGYKKALERLDEAKKKISDREAKLRGDSWSHQKDKFDADYKIPKDITEVLNNSGQSYTRARQVLVKLFDNNPDSDAGGFITNSIKAINKKEVELYTDIFSDEGFARYEAKLQAKAAPIKLSKKEESLVDAVQTKMGVIRNLHAAGTVWAPLDQAMALLQRIGNPRYDKIADRFRNALDEAIELGSFDSLLDVVFGDFPKGPAQDILTDALGIAKNRNSMKAGRGSKRINFEQSRDAFRRANTIDLSQEEMESLLHKFRMGGAQIKANLARYENEFTAAYKIIDDTGRGFPEKTKFAAQGPLNYIPESSISNTSSKSLIDGLLKELNYSAYDDLIVAKAFKSIEDIQTILLKSLEYGAVSPSVTVTSAIQDDIIAVLREEMKDKSRWGQMAKLKDQFDQQAGDFKKFRDNISSSLTSEVGPDVLGDPKAFMNLIKNLDNHNSDIVLKQINGYGKSGRDLIDFIRRNFDEAGVEKKGVSSGIADKLPGGVQGAINKKIKEIDDIGANLGASVSGVKEPGLLWDSRLKNMVDYSSETNIKLDELLEKIRAKIPIADAMLATNASNANLNSITNSLGRGGILSVLAYGVTGSKKAAAAAGAAVGAANMALDPKDYLQLMNQMSIIHRTNKTIIKEYMEDWVTNTLPKSAIAGSWEKTSRSMLMVSSQPYQRDKKENRTAIRKKMARSRNTDSWSAKIEEAITSELTEDNFFESSSAIRQLASSRFLMEKFINETTKVFEQTPDIRNAMKVVIERKIKISNKLLPKINTGTMFSDPVPPSSYQLQEFARSLQVLNSPKDTILTGMLSGTLTVKMVAVLSEAWPKLYKEIVTAAMDAVSDPEVRNNLSYSQKLVLSTLTGSQIMDHSEASRLSESFAAKEEKGGGQGGPRPGGMDDTAEALGAGTMNEILNRR